MQPERVNRPTAADRANEAAADLGDGGRHRRASPTCGRVRRCPYGRSPAREGKATKAEGPFEKVTVDLVAAIDEVKRD
jgi:hypothetical protein